MIIRYHSAVSVASLYDTLSNPFLALSHHQAEMAWTSLLVIGVLICTVVYSDIQFTSDSDPLINHNLLAYLSSREDLVSYLSSYSNNIADTTLDSLSSAGTYKISYHKQRYNHWVYNAITIEEGNQEFSTLAWDISVLFHTIIGQKIYLIFRILRAAMPGGLQGVRFSANWISIN